MVKEGVVVVYGVKKVVVGFRPRTRGTNICAPAAFGVR